MNKIIFLIVITILVSGCTKIEKKEKIEEPRLGIKNTILPTDASKDPLKKIADWDKNKPTTDAEWAEDTKQESLDLKLNSSLAKMKDSLNEKLPKLQKELNEMVAYPDYMKYEMRDRFKDQGLTEEEITAEVEKLYAGDLVNKEWEVAKIIQSTERINKELELRDKGYLILDKGENGEPILGASDNVASERIRHIND